MELCINRYNDSWMDNAIENFYYLLNTFDYNSEISLILEGGLLKINCDKEVFKKVLIEIFNNHKQFVCVNKEEDDIVKEYKKDFILIQHKRKDQYISLNPKIFQNTEEEVPKLVDLFEEGSKKCILCGSSFKRKYSDLTQGAYPFVTKIKSLNGIRSYRDGEYYTFRDYNDSVCPLCYLIGQLGWLTDKFIYRTFYNDRSYLFLPNSNNLEKLCEFKSDYLNLLNNNERWSNIKVSLINEKGEITNGKFSTLLCFYSRFYEMYDISVSDEIEDISWDIIEIPWGKVKNVKSTEFSFEEKILNIVKAFIDEDEDVYALFNSVLFFKKDVIDWDLTNRIRENLSESFLKNDFRRFSRNFIPRSGGKISYTNKNIAFLEYFDFLIKLWRFNSMSVSVDDLKTIKSVGNIIAKVSVINSSLFYKLDKVRSIDDFWGVLREISRKLVNTNIDKSMIREKALDELIVLLKSNEDDWKEIRDLLIVYAAMYYSIGSRDGEEDGN